MNIKQNKEYGSNMEMLENISEQLSFAFWVSNPIYMSFIPTLLIRSEAVPSAPSEVSGQWFIFVIQLCFLCISHFS